MPRCLGDEPVAELLGLGDTGDVLGRARHGEVLAERREQALAVPIVGIDVGGRPLVHGVDDHALDEVERLLAEALPLEDLAALAVDHRALAVHDLVVFEDVLAALVVELLDLLLRVLDGARDHLGLDRLALRPLQPFHDRAHLVGGEHPHQVVFEREVEQRRARVPLAPGAAAQLVVDAPRLVPFGAEHIQTPEPDHLVVLGVGLVLELREHRLVLGLVDGALLVIQLEQQVAVVVELARGHLLARQVLGVAPEQDVDTATGHVGRDGDRALAPGLGDDLRLLSRGSWR